MTHPTPLLFDTHCHLDYLEEGLAEHSPAQPLPDVLERAQAQGVGWIINPSVSPDRFAAVLSVAERFENVFAAVAVHPTDVNALPDDNRWLAEIEQHLKHPKVVAVGETGLDYYWDTTHKARQQACFSASLALARQHQLPIIVHDRDAHEDIYTLIQAEPGVTGVMHCFSGDADFALRMVELGFYISFAGNVTFKKAEALREAASVVPLERLLVETDSPFLSPVPFRGKPNEPARVRLVAECIAALRNLPLDVLAETTTANARRLFQRVN
ncbi:MAG: TatD family hydrolase [Candidatus Melainabacteria bacterium]|nr:TatD family hydrolase [Candidatus Melainabacteria bacterium]